MVEQKIPKIISRPAGNRSVGRIGRIIKKIAYVVALVAIISGIFYWVTSDSDFSIHNYPKNKWQAVFLSNGQIYFGHVTKVTKKSVVLEDIYYLQVVTVPLQRSQESPSAANEQEQRLTLIKLGNEIHGPYDRMNINLSHVVLMENLKDNSRVVEAITKYIEDQKK